MNAVDGRHRDGSGRDRSRSRPASRLPRMAAIPPCATAPAWRCEDLGAPFDVLWLRLPVLPGDPVDLIGRVNGGQLFVMIYRNDYWQCAYLIPKGGFDAIKADGLEKFRDRLKLVAGFAAARIDDCITDFDQIKLLTVTVDRLKQWARPGLLCIGDAAHAMSPIGGVGINLAIQDAVATANILGPDAAARHAKLRRSQDRAGAAANFPPR